MTGSPPRSLPRVLVLDEAVPLPANTGKRLRTHNLLRRLAGEFEIHLLVHAGEVEADAARALEREGIRLHVADSVVPDKSGPAFAARLLGNLAFSRLPYSVASHRQRAYRTRLRNLLQPGGFRLVHCEWTPYAGYAAGLDLPVTVAAHNVETDIWRRLAEQSPGPRAALYGVQARRMERFEREICRSGRALTAVSEGDARRLEEWGASRVAVIPNGVDLDYYRPAPLLPEEPGSLVFSGSMDWRANQDAVIWFLDAVQPELRRRCDFKFTVVGRNPPSRLLRRANERVRVTGTVPDVRPFLVRSQVFVTPLRVGGGSRLKILEALALKRAVVSTTVGAEGLDVEPGRHLLVADEPAEFAEAVSRLLGDPELRRRLGESGRELVEERYDWDRLAALQAEFWRREIYRAAPYGQARGPA